MPLGLEKIKSAFPQLSGLQELFVGGQKEVFTGKDGPGNDVVLKLLLDPRSSSRLQREIQAVHLLTSPNIPQIYSYGKIKIDSADLDYLIEQKIDGQSLENLISQNRIFDLQEIVKCLQTLLEICVQAESASGGAIVHRDIKPDNVLLDSQGKFWLIDFGIARHLNLPSITDTHAMYGPHTLGFSSPEQIRNSKKEIDSRSDLFAIGVTLIVMVTHSNPLTNGANSAIEVVRRTETMSIPVFPITGDAQNQLSTFITLLCDRRLSHRPRTAREALDIFNAIKPTLVLN